ncbi:hypothetical protein NSQ45_00940 [Caldifermentibacillus hisashii]|uniref:hypothetical protein n=1 Tax=Caldifermentibacillus hisashii TaxID=996558 RepID=UPI0031B78F5A
MPKLQQYDLVVLKDGREAFIVEVLSESDFIVDVGSSPEDWDTIQVTIEEIDFIRKRR